MKHQQKQNRISQNIIKFSSSIVGKFSFGMLLWFLVIGALGSYGLFNLQKFQLSLEELTAETLPQAGNVSRLSTATSSLTGTVRRLALVDTQTQRRLVYEEIAREFAAVDTLAAGLSDETNTVAFDGILRAIKQLVDQLNVHIENRIIVEAANQKISIQLTSILNEPLSKLSGTSDRQKAQLLIWENKITSIVALAIQNINIDRLRGMRLLRRNLTRQLRELKELEADLPPIVSDYLQEKERNLEGLLVGDNGYFDSLVEGLKLTARVRGLENQILTLNEEVIKLSNDVFRGAGKEVEDSVRTVNQGFKAQFNYTLMAGGITILSIIGIAIIINKVFVTRLNRLNREVQEYSENDKSLITVSGNDEITGIANSISSFIGEIEAQQTELRSAKANAEDATRIKSEFLATMSHEIRTPMNGVVSMTQMLAKTQLDHRQKELIAIVEQSAGSLLTIINDILDFSRIEAGKLEIEEVEFDLHELVASVSALCGSDAYDKGLELFFDIDSAVSSNLVGDSTRIRQILLNLASNAVKFTESGYVKIGVALSEGAKEKALMFKVEDTGIGISDEAIKRLFVAFEQADGSTVRRFGGSGLGLSICKRLVDLMGGEIGVKSIPDTGSVFYFTVPFNPVALEEKTHVTDLPASNVYVAVQHEKTLELIASVFPGDHYNLIALDASAPQSWAGMIRKAGGSESADLFLFDVDVAPKSENLPYIQAMHKDYHMDVFAIAPRSQMADLEIFTDTWLIGVLPKPLNRFALVDQIITCKDLSDLGANTRHSSKLVQDDNQETANVSTASILIAEDNPINQKVIATTLDHLGYSYSIVSDGEEAYEAIERELFSIVLTDFHMPRMDGVMLTKMLKAHDDEKINKVPVIILTADAQMDAQNICIEAGADGFLTKPINLKALSDELSKWLPV